MEGPQEIVGVSVAPEVLYKMETTRAKDIIICMKKRDIFHKIKNKS